MATNRKQKPYDWEEIRNAFLQNDLTVKEASEMCGVCVQTFYNWLYEDTGRRGKRDTPKKPEAQTFSVWPEKKKLDTFYFRVIRDHQWTTVCFTDMTESEQRKALVSFEAQDLRQFVVCLAQIFRDTIDAQEGKRR